MATGKTHEKGSIGGLAILIGGAIVLFVSFGWSKDIFYMILGGFLSFLIDPDMMDQHNITTRGENRLYRIPIIGWCVGYAIEICIYPLARLIPHRSAWSHFPPLSSALRLLYIGLWAYLIGQTIYPDNWPRPELNQMQLLYIYAGSVWIDIIHTTLDKWKIRF